MSPIPECWHNHRKLIHNTQSESIKVCLGSNWENVLSKDGRFLGIPQVTSRRTLSSKFILLLYLKKKKKDVEENLPAKIKANPRTVFAIANLHHKNWHEYCIQLCTGSRIFFGGGTYLNPIASVMGAPRVCFIFLSLLGPQALSKVASASFCLESRGSPWSEVRRVP